MFCQLAGKERDLLLSKTTRGWRGEECRCFGGVPRHLTIHVVMPSDICSLPEGNLPDRVTTGLNSKQFIVLTPVSLLVVCVYQNHWRLGLLFPELEIFFTSL